MYRGVQISATCIASSFERHDEGPAIKEKKGLGSGVSNGQGGAYHKFLNVAVKCQGSSKNENRAEGGKMEGVQGGIRSSPRGPPIS